MFLLTKSKSATVPRRRLLTALVLTTATVVPVQFVQVWRREVRGPLSRRGRKPTNCVRTHHRDVEERRRADGRIVRWRQERNDPTAGLICSIG